MFSKKMQKALNDHLNAELYAAYLYLAMAAYFESTHLPGFANWMRLQSREEMAHAMRFYEYINERGGRVELQAIDKPPVNFKSPLAVFEQALKHERVVSKEIDKLFDMARKEKDYASEVFLQWFVTEQVEEEQSAEAVVEALKMIGDQRPALLMYDRELGQRQAE
ncbi:MAG: ferritin [bacterium]